MYRKLQFIIIIFILQITFFCCANEITKEEKIRVFYENDHMFFFGEKDDEKMPFMIEEGSENLISNIEKISKEYQNIVKEYLMILSNFISKNIIRLQEFYISAIDDNISLAVFEENRDIIEKEIRLNLLPKLKNGIRCMLAVGVTQYIEVARRIDNNKYAVTLFINTGDGVYWIYYLQHPELRGIPRNEILDSEGHIKYSEWFYESNLKIRIVKQIRDNEGNYYGELYADYYKLDKYDELFDKEGNPLKPKSEK